MKDIFLTIKVMAEDHISSDEVAASIDQLINAGLSDAQDTLEACEGNLVAAELATSIHICSPRVAARPRVLITVAGDVADAIRDEAVEVEVFDFDAHDGDRCENSVSAHFRDLAEPRGVPVRE